MLNRANRSSWSYRIMVRSAALLAAVGLFAAVDARAQVVAPPQQASIINNALSKAWTDLKLTRAKPATDNEFLRRSFLDILGRIPTPEEVLDYENDKSTAKRAKLIRRILSLPPYKDEYTIKGRDGKKIVFEYAREYAEHWADIWTVWTMTRSGTHETYHNEIRFWFEKKFMNNTPHDEMVRELLTAKGPGNTNGATNFIMAHLGEATPLNIRISDGPFDAVPITSRVTRLFLGVQTQCTQCHDHPFNPEWGQENFWGVNAFFRQTTRSATPTAAVGALNKKQKGMVAAKVEVEDDPKLNSSQRIFYEKRSGVLMSLKPTFLPNLADLEKDKSERAKKPLPANAGKSRREILADYVIAHDNFGKAFVNRMWAHFFGRGLNESPAADDFGGHNKVVHPEMLEQLGQEFIKYKYDPKAVIEWICNSDAYNLSYVAPSKDMSKPEYDAYFARMPLKAMSPEVLFNSLETAVKADMAVDREARKTARENWMKKLVNNFGDDEGNEMTFNGTIVQALLMMNGKELNDEIKRKDGVVAKAMRRGSADAIINELYLTALGRRPSLAPMIVKTYDPKTKKTTSHSYANELAFIHQMMNYMGNEPTWSPQPKGKGKGKNKPAPAATGPEAFYQDVFWTLLNTSEFMLNH